MRRFRRRTLVLAVMLALGGQAPAGIAEGATAGGAPDGGPVLDSLPPTSLAGHFRTWEGTPSGIPGETAFDRREVIVTDHPFDDHGADIGLPDARTFEPANVDVGFPGAAAASGGVGDYRYPSDPAYANNAADIVEVRVAADPANWYLLVVLNTLVDSDRTAIEARTDGKALLAHGSEGTLDGKPVDVWSDEERNFVEVRISRAVYDPETTARPVFVAAGLWDPSNDSWLDPDPVGAAPPYFDLAYVPGEGIDSYWRDRRQALDIAAGAFDEDAFPVDFGRLLDDPCDRVFCVHVSPFRGLHTRVFRSGQGLGEGVAPQSRYGGDGLGFRVYRSTHQPYAVYEPFSDPAAPRPLVLLLHSTGGNHMSFVLTSGPKHPLLGLSHLTSWADETNAIVAMPLARGEGGWYEGEAEKDVFEVWRDVARHFNVDRERVYVAGVGMGGFGSYRLAHLYPDQFAGAIAWAAPVTPASIWVPPVPAGAPTQNPPGCGGDEPTCGYNLVDLFGNARSVPHLIVHGGMDEVVPVAGPEEWTTTLAESGSGYRYVLYPGRRHETSFPGTTAHRVSSFLGDFPIRQRSPMRVTYRVLRDLFQSQFGITYRGAYWVGGLELAPGRQEGIVDAQRADLSVDSLPETFGGDSLGPFRLRGQNVVSAQPSSNALELDLSGFVGSSIDVARAGLIATAPLSLSIATDTAAEVQLVGAFPTQVQVTGATYRRQGSSVVLVVPPGESSVSVVPQ